MRLYSLGQISPEEKSDILEKHRTIYNGYRTMQPEVSNTQPLYVQDFANDKNGVTVTNKGEVKKYTNVGINESEDNIVKLKGCDEDISEGIFDDIIGGKPKKIDTIDYDGYEIDVWSDKKNVLYGHPRKKGENKSYTKHLLVYDNLNSLKKAIDSLNKEERGENTGISDWQNADEPMDMSGSAVPSFFPKPVKKIKSPDFKGFAVESVNEEKNKQVCSECGGMMTEGECMECGWKGDMGEQTPQVDALDNVEDLNGEFDYTEEVAEQGGNADDMDVSDVKPAYDFVSGGPESDDDYDEMTSAWDDFDDYNEDFDDDNLDFIGSEDEMSLDDADDDHEDFDPKDKSWEEIKAHTGNWDEIDEDIKESFVAQKNKISEMMIRMRVI